MTSGFGNVGAISLDYARESLEKCLPGANNKKKKNGETETKRVLNNMRMPKLQAILTAVVTYCHHYVRLAVLQNVFAIILLCASEGVENLSKKLYASKIKKKEESDTKSSV